MGVTPSISWQLPLLPLFPSSNVDEKSDLRKVLSCGVIFIFPMNEMWLNVVLSKKIGALCFSNLTIRTRTGDRNTAVG